MKFDSSYVGSLVTGNTTQLLKAGNSSQVNCFAGIKIKNHPGLMGFRGVNLGITMSGQALWWERKLNCRRESGSQDYATVSVEMAGVRSVFTHCYLGCNCHEMGFSSLEEQEFYTKSSHFLIGTTS